MRTDIVMSGSTAVVAIGGGKAALVDVTNPLTPNRVGVIDGVGTRLALTESNLLVSTYRTYLSGVNNPLQGIHVAAFGKLPLVEFDPARIVVGESGYETAESFKLKYRVIPASTEVRSAKVQWRIGEATHSEVNAPMTDGVGALDYPLGFNIPRVGTVLARPRLVINPGEADEIAGPLKAWKTEKPEVEFVWAERDVEQTLYPEAFLKGEFVTTDLPELETRVVSQEWLRRSLDAPPGETRQVDWQAFSAPASMAGATLAKDGIFSTPLRTGTVSGQTRSVEARAGEVVLGTAGPFVLEPGAPHTIDVTAERPTVAADEASEVVLTAEVRDQYGNAVANGTPVSWEVAEGSDDTAKVKGLDQATTDGRARAKYRAGSKAGAQTVRALAQSVAGEFSVQQAMVGLQLVAPASKSWSDRSPVELTLNATGSEPVADGAKIGWFASIGRLVETQPMTDGVAKARWEFEDVTYRPRVDFVVILGAGRAQQRMLWMESSRAPGGNGRQTTSGAHIAAVEPMMIAGDLTGDGSVDVELADGSFEAVSVKATATYRLMGLAPGERVRVQLGNNLQPNQAPILHLADQIDGTVIHDLTGVHDGQVSGGVSRGTGGYRNLGLAFDGTGRITIPHEEEFDFAGGFMVQAAVRPPIAPQAEEIILDKAGDYRLSLVEEAGGTYARFTVHTASGAVSVISQSTVPRGAWTLLSGRFESGRLYVSLDKLDTSQPLGEAPLHSTSSLVIGEGYVGELDEVRAFDLSRQALSTFANGQQSISFTADSSGRFETQIVSTGQFTRDSQTAHYLAALAAQAAAAGEPLTDRSYGAYFTTAETYWEDTAESASTSYGYVGAKTMAFFAKFGRGVFVGSGGGGDIDPAVLAGDMLGSIFLAPVTMVRDIFNALDRAIAMQATGGDALDLSLGVVNIAATLVKGKLGTLANSAKFIKLIGKNSRASGAMARLVALEARVAVGAGGVSRIKKLLEVANLTYASGQAVKGIVDALGSREDSAEHVSNILEGADDAPGVAEELNTDIGDIPAEHLRLLVEAAGEPEAAPSAPGPNAAASPGGAAGTPGQVLLRWSRRGLRGVMAGGKELRGQALESAAKTLAGRIRFNYGRFAPELCEKLGRVISHNAQGLPENLHMFLRTLATSSSRVWKGAQRVLNVSEKLANPATRAEALSALRINGTAFDFKAFEAREFIRALQTASGAARQRIYDVVIKVGGKLHRLEIKDWDVFPPNKYALKGAVDQMRRDLLKHVLKEDGFDITRLRWVLGKHLGGQQQAIIKALKKAIDGEFVKGLGQGLSPGQIATFKAEAEAGLSQILTFL